jgi:hypothetical protein
MSYNYAFHIRYNKQEKKMERDVLRQGIRLSIPDLESQDQLPSATPLPSSLAPVDFPQPFTFLIPENTTGKVRGFGTRPPPPTPPVLPTPPPLPQQLPQPHPIMPTQSTATCIQPEQNRSQFHYQKRKAEKEASGISVRKYQRSSKPIVCGKCKQTRDPATHRQFFGNWYCQATESQTYESWRDALNEKKRIQKEKGINFVIIICNELLFYFELL